jgi:hypothetical protein
MIGPPGFDRRLAGELLAEHRGGALAQAFAWPETDAHQHRRSAWNQQQHSALVVALRNICPMPQVSAVTRMGNMLIDSRAT